MPKKTRKLSGGYLGLDLSLTSTGIGYELPGDEPFRETRVIRDGERLRGLRRIVAIRDKVVGYVRERSPELIAIEGYSYHSRQTSHLADRGELGGAVKLALLDLGYDEEKGSLLIVPPNSLKLFVSGKGNCSKSQMVLSVYKRWGIEAKFDDEADAFGLAMFAWAWSLGPKKRERLLTQFQMAALRGLEAAANNKRGAKGGRKGGGK